MIIGFDGSISLNNGKFLSREKICELTNYIIDKFAEENLSFEEANAILEKTKECIRESAVVQKL